MPQTGSLESALVKIVFTLIEPAQILFQGTVLYHPDVMKIAIREYRPIMANRAFGLTKKKGSSH